MKWRFWTVGISAAVLAVAAPALANDGGNPYPVNLVSGMYLSSYGQPMASPEPQAMPAPDLYADKGDMVDCGTCWQVYGDALLLRPGNDKVAFGVPINGAIVPPVGAPPVQIGREAVADPGFDIGFRVGLTRAISDCSTIGVSYTWFEADDAADVNVLQPNVLRSLVNHPGSTDAATDFIYGVANNLIRYRLADVDFRRILWEGDDFSLNYLVGARYAHLDEVFNSTFINSTTTENVNTNIDFDGGGIRLGLEGERQSCAGWLVYGKGYASFVGGRFVGNYTQADSFRGTVVSTGWTEDRVISILDIEAGIGYACCNNRIRVTAGYMFSGWYNAINTDDFIRAVQTNNSVSVSDTLTFDGLVLRSEIRF